MTTEDDSKKAPTPREKFGETFSLFSLQPSAQFPQSISNPF